MNFYAYIPREDGSEPTGSSGTVIFQNEEFKTLNGVIRRCKYKLNWNSHPFEIYTFDKFYDDSSFKLMYKNKP